MGRLRFCMLTTFYPPYHFGGDAVGVERLSHALARRGHHVTVIHDLDAYRALQRAPPGTPAAEPHGVTVHRLRSGVGVLSALATQQLGRPVFTRRQIRRILAAGRFDVVNFHNVSLIGGPGLLAEGGGVKLYLAHEHWLVCPTHVLWRHDREVCTGRQCLRCVLHYRRPPQLWRWTGLLERQLAHVHAFVAMSEFSRAKHAEFGFPRQMEVLPYFLPDPESPAAPPATTAPAPHPRPYYLFVGRLERLKGLDDVIPLFARHRDADLLIAGDGTHGPSLRALAAGIPGVRFIGRLEGEALRTYYAHALALIVPSLGFETFGIVLIEAFRERTPVIARRVGPFAEIVQQAGAGELFGDPEELRRVMVRIGRDPAARERMAGAAYQAYVERFSERAVVPRYLDIVRRAAERAGDARVAGLASEGSP